MKIDNTQTFSTQSTALIQKQPAVSFERNSGSNVSPVISVVAGQLASETTLSQQTQTDVGASLTPDKLQEVNRALAVHSSEMQFQLDQDAGRMILYLKDKQTGEVLRQFPDKEALRVSKQIDDYLAGLKSVKNPKDAVGQLAGLVADIKA